MGSQRVGQDWATNTFFHLHRASGRALGVALLAPSWWGGGGRDSSPRGRLTYMETFLVVTTWGGGATHNWWMEAGVTAEHPDGQEGPTTDYDPAPVSTNAKAEKRCFE